MKLSATAMNDARNVGRGAIKVLHHLLPISLLPTALASVSAPQQSQSDWAAADVMRANASSQPAPLRAPIAQRSAAALQSLPSSHIERNFPSSSPLDLSSKRALKEQRVPSNRFSRAAGFGGMAAGMVGGTVSAWVQGMSKPMQSTGTAPPDSSPLAWLLPGAQSAMLSEGNADRLAEGLCRMRGAALKLGQVLSIQDQRLVPPVLTAALERVRAAANVMPADQLQRAMRDELGAEWRQSWAHFDEKPFAAASIGQVHAGQLHDGTHTVTKVQYPGVAGSIDSDIRNLTMLLKMAAALPPGLFLEHAIEILREELEEECDFKLEASKQRGFAADMSAFNFNLQLQADEGLPQWANTPAAERAGSDSVPLGPGNWPHAAPGASPFASRAEQLQGRFPQNNLFHLALALPDEKGAAKHGGTGAVGSAASRWADSAAGSARMSSLPLVHVPLVVDTGSARGVLTTSFAPGRAIDAVQSAPQAVRDSVGTALLASTMQQLFVMRSLQSDPNWGNYLYDDAAHVLTMIDFGALREYPAVFVSDYLQLVTAAAAKDKDSLVAASTRLGFLTGHESPSMLDASVAAGLIVGEPFAPPAGWQQLQADDPARYSPEHCFDFGATDMTLRVAAHGEALAEGTLTPPPREAYSLHRILSGAFLTCMKLGARVPARALLEDVTAQASLANTPSA